ncbi:MAG: ABC transporter permease [Limnochordia bacterium]|jgi:lipoprotein-releasing system permease protein
MPFSLWMAARYIFHRPRVSGVAAGGVAVAVAVMIMVMGITNGLNDYLIQRLLGLEAHLELLAGVDLPLEGFEAWQSSVGKEPYVQSVEPYVQGQVLLGRTGLLPRGVYLRGLRDPIVQLDPYLTVRSEDEEGIFIGEDLALALGLDPGSEAIIIGGRGNSRSFPVSGFFRTGLEEYDQGMVYLPLDAAQEMLGYLPHQVTGLAVYLSDPLEAGQRAESLQALTGLWVRSWQVRHKNLLATAKVEQRALMIIVLATFAVAGIGVGNILWLNVWEKRRDIGVLQALGAKGSLLARIFFYQGVLLGVAGIGFGFLLGLSLLLWLQGRPIHVPELTFAQHLPVVIKGKDLILAGGAALIVAGGAGLAAAREVSRQKIAEVLVGE